MPIQIELPETFVITDETRCPRPEHEEMFLTLLGGLIEGKTTADSIETAVNGWYPHFRTYIEGLTPTERTAFVTTMIHASLMVFLRDRTEIHRQVIRHMVERSSKKN